MTQMDLSEAVGVASSYISKIENGQADPDTELLRKIANALGVAVTDFFDGPPPILGSIVNPQFAIFFKLAGHLTDEEMRDVMNIAQAIAALEDPDKEAVESLIARLKRK